MSVSWSLDDGELRVRVNFFVLVVLFSLLFDDRFFNEFVRLLSRSNTSVRPAVVVDVLLAVL